jgi:hypothetical protein
MSLRLRAMFHVAILVVTLLGVSNGALAAGRSQVVRREIHSTRFENTKIGTVPFRRFMVYLPPDYDPSSRGYPVIYYMPDAIEGYKSPFETQQAEELFDSAIAHGIVGRFIFVSVDMNTPVASSWCVNSPVTGNWEDFVVEELVPYIDSNFKTLANRDSRGIAGDRVGAYCALRLAMRRPDVFGSVYGMDPVGAGSGEQILGSRPNWDLLMTAKSIDEVRKDSSSTIFLSIFQAFLPDPVKAPLFIDLPARREGDRMVIDANLNERLSQNFFLESMIPQYADKMKSLRGIKFDWGHRDPDHGYSNQAFTRRVNDFGIPHEVEAYKVGSGDRIWGEDGRIYTEVLPFFRRRLAF